MIINFTDIQKSVLEEYQSLLKKDTDIKFPLLIAQIAAQISVMCLAEYHQQLTRQLNELQ